MALCDQFLPNIRAISPYLAGKPITQLAREMGKKMAARLTGK